MAYDTAKRAMGKRPAVVVELHLDRCPLTWGATTGAGTCTATGTTTRKCYNTWGTCQAPDSYESGSYIVRFASEIIDSLQQPGDGPTFPTLVDIDDAPTRLDPGNGLSVRASLRVNIQDHPYSDGQMDPYLSDRDFAPFELSTLWPKLIKRQRYWTNRRIDILTGFLDENGDLQNDDFRRRTYIVQGVAGPDERGMVTIDAKDPLRLADGDRAKYPLETSWLTLSADIDENATSVPFSIASGHEIADVHAWYTGGDRYIRVGDESMQVTGYTTEVFTVVRRSLPSYYAEYTFDPIGHTTGDLIQLGRNFSDERVDDIIYDLLVDGAGIDPSYIDTAAWATLVDEWGSSYLYSALLLKSTSVKQLLTELTNHLWMLWWDDRNAKISLDILKLQPGALVPAALEEDDSILGGTIGTVEDQSRRVTGVWCYYGVRNPLEDLGEASNYRGLKLSENVDRSSSKEYSQRGLKIIWSRWLPADRLDVASEITSRYLEFYQDAKRVLMFDVDVKDDDLWTGAQIDVKTDRVLDVYGQRLTLRYMILSSHEMWDGGNVKLRYTLASMNPDRVQRIGVIAPNTNPEDEPETFPDYDAASDALKLRYCFICQNDGLMPDGTQGYEIV